MFCRRFRRLSQRGEVLHLMKQNQMKCDMAGPGNNRHCSFIWPRFVVNQIIQIQHWSNIQQFTISTCTTYYFFLGIISTTYHDVSVFFLCSTLVLCLMAKHFSLQWLQLTQRPLAPRPPPEPLAFKVIPSTVSALEALEAAWGPEVEEEERGRLGGTEGCFGPALAKGWRGECLEEQLSLSTEEYVTPCSRFRCYRTAQLVASTTSSNSLLFV